MNETAGLKQFHSTCKSDVYVYKEGCIYAIFCDFACC